MWEGFKERAEVGNGGVGVIGSVRGCEGKTLVCHWLQFVHIQIKLQCCCVMLGRMLIKKSIVYKQAPRKPNAVFQYWMHKISKPKGRWRGFPPLRHQGGTCHALMGMACIVIIRTIFKSLDSLIIIQVNCLFFSLVWVLSIIKLGACSQYFSCVVIGSLL